MHHRHLQLGLQHKLDVGHIPDVVNCGVAFLVWFVTRAEEVDGGVEGAK